MHKVQVLHCVCVDYNSECLPFFLHQKSLQRWIRFYKRAESLRVACQINLGKPSGGKTPTGPLEYLGHASAESQAKEEMFEGFYIIPAGVTAPHIGKIDHTFVHSAAGMQCWISRFGLFDYCCSSCEESSHAAFTPFEDLWRACCWRRHGFFCNFSLLLSAREPMKGAAKGNSLCELQNGSNKRPRRLLFGSPRRFLDKLCTFQKGIHRCWEVESRWVAAEVNTCSVSLRLSKNCNPTSRTNAIKRRTGVWIFPLRDQLKLAIFQRTQTLLEETETEVECCCTLLEFDSTDSERPVFLVIWTCGNLGSMLALHGFQLNTPSH